jgi:hypothetical protein
MSRPLADLSRLAPPSTLAELVASRPYLARATLRAAGALLAHATLSPPAADLLQRYLVRATAVLAADANANVDAFGPAGASSRIREQASTAVLPRSNALISSALAHAALCGRAVADRHDALASILLAEERFRALLGASPVCNCAPGHPLLPTWTDGPPSRPARALADFLAALASGVYADASRQEAANALLMEVELACPFLAPTPADPSQFGDI